MPSGREMYTVKPWTPPVLEAQILENMRVPPDHVDDYGKDGSSDDETREQAPAGAFPGTKGDYSGSGNYY